MSSKEESDNAEAPTQGGNGGGTAPGNGVGGGSRNQLPRALALSLDRPQTLAILASQLLRPNQAMTGDCPMVLPNGIDDHQLKVVLRAAERLLSLAGEGIVDEVHVYQVFEQDGFMSEAEICNHLKNNCAWPSLDTPYFVETAVKKLFADAHEEIQNHRRCKENAILQKEGKFVNVIEAESTIRRVIKALLRGIRLHELLGDDGEAALRDVADCAMEGVLAGIARNERLAASTPLITEEFFEKVCQDASYETYLGTIDGPGTINSDALRGVLESLETRFEDILTEEDARIGKLEELQKIEKWLTSRTNLEFDDEGVFARTIAEFEKLDGAVDEAEDPGAEVRAAYKKGLGALAEEWSMVRLRELVRPDGFETAIPRIEAILSNHSSSEKPDTNDIDEWDRFNQFPHCADNVLKWLKGKRAFPRIFYQHLDMPSSSSNMESCGRLVIKRQGEFEACVTELEDCLVCSAIKSDVDIFDILPEINNRLVEEAKNYCPPSDEIREATREAGKNLLDGVCSTKDFSPGNINPHLLFKYAADSGINKIGKKGNQMLVAERSKLNPGCVVVG
jgi:hypothetical protein